MGKHLEYNATLEQRIDVTPALSIFKVKADAGVLPRRTPRFVPGQYAVLGLNNEAKPDLGSVRRPMSIVSAPEEEGPLEFYIRYVSKPESNNPLTHLLWDMKAGDRMYLEPRIVGKFTLADTLGEDGGPASIKDKLKVCVAAGTGLAPFLSYVRSACLRDPNCRLEDFVILHGASYPADLGYRDELRRLQQEHGLHYFCTVSRPNEAPDWDGDAGRVEDYFLPERLEALEKRMGMAAGDLSPDKAAVLVCGLHGTIGETLMRLMPRGFAPKNRRLRRVLQLADDVKAGVYYEPYDNNPVINVDDAALMASLREQLLAARGA